MITQNICHEPECNINPIDFPSIDKQVFGDYCYFHSIGKVIESLRITNNESLLQEQFQKIIDEYKRKARLLPNNLTYLTQFIELLKKQENLKIENFYAPLEQGNFIIKVDTTLDIKTEFVFCNLRFYDYNQITQLIDTKQQQDVIAQIQNISRTHVSTIIKFNNLKFDKKVKFSGNTDVNSLTFEKCIFESGLEILFEKEKYYNSIELSNDCSVNELLKIHTNNLIISNCIISCDEIELAVPFGQLTLINPIYKEYLFKDSSFIEIYDGVNGEPYPLNGKPTGSCEHVDVSNILFHDTTLYNKNHGYSKQIIDNLGKIKFANCNFNKNHTLYDNHYSDYSNIIVDKYLSTENKFFKIFIWVLGFLAISIILWLLATKQWQNAEHNLGLISSIISLVILFDFFVIKKITSIQLISLLIEIILFPILILTMLLQEAFIGKSYKIKTPKIVYKIITTMEKVYELVPVISPKALILYFLLVLLLLIFIATQSLFIFAIVLFIAYIFQTKYLYYDGEKYKTILKKLKNKKNIFKRLEYSYIHLREHYDSNKDYLAANDFHYNYMEAKRQNTQNFLDKLILLFYGYVNGYNTKPWRTFLWLMILPILFTLVFGLGMNWYNLNIQTGIDKDNKAIVINIQNEKDWQKKLEYLLGYNYRNITFLNILKDSDIYETNDATTLLLTSSENALALVLITLGIPAFYNRYRRNKSDSGGEFK